MKKNKIMQGLLGVLVFAPTISHADLIIDEKTVSVTPSQAVSKVTEQAKETVKEVKSVVKTAPEKMSKTIQKTVSEVKQAPTKIGEVSGDYVKTVKEVNGVKVYSYRSKESLAHNQQPKISQPIVVAKAESPKVIKSTPAKEMPKAKKIGKGYVTHIGEQQKSESIDGFAQDLPLKIALEQIVPKGWKLNKKGNVNLEELVDWQGGKSWDKIFETVVTPQYFALIDWDSKTILLSTQLEKQAVKKVIAKPATTVVPVVERGLAKEKVQSQPVQAKAQPAPAVVKQEVEQGKYRRISHEEYLRLKNKNADVAKNYSQSTVTNPVVKATVGQPVEVKAKPVSSKTWTLKKGLTLKENITQWGKKEGWEVVWKAPDYKVIADTKLYGEIDSENGPIISILKEYNDTTLPLKVDIYGGNKVISVEGRNFTPTSGVDLSEGDKRVKELLDNKFLR